MEGESGDTVRRKARSGIGLRSWGLGQSTVQGSGWRSVRAGNNVETCLVGHGHCSVLDGRNVGLEPSTSIARGPRPAAAVVVAKHI
jgi:hypothetical protein